MVRCITPFRFAATNLFKVQPVTTEELTIPPEQEPTTSADAPAHTGAEAGKAANDEDQAPDKSEDSKAEEVPDSCGEALLLPVDGMLHTLGGKTTVGPEGLWVSALLEEGEYEISGVKAGGEVLAYRGGCGNLSLEYDSSVRPGRLSDTFSFRLYVPEAEPVLLRFDNFSENQILGARFTRMGFARTSAADWNLYK